MKNRLSDAQWRLLAELNEPYTSAHQDAWYFPRKNLRTLMSLAAFGYARYVQDTGYSEKVGYAITLSGKEKLAEYGKR